MIKRAEAIAKAMKDLRRLSSESEIRTALNTRNGPTPQTMSLHLQNEVRVWREKDGWQGPYKISNIDGQRTTVDMVNGPVIFISTHVRPYYRNHETNGDDKVQDSNTNAISDAENHHIDPPEPQIRR